MPISSIRSSILATALQETSAHGLPRTAAGRNRLVRIIWALAFVGLLAYFTTQLVGSVQRVLEKPVSTAVEPNSKPFEFPVLHVCFEPIVSASYTATLSADLKSFLNQIIQQSADQLMSNANVYSVSKLFMNSLNYTFISQFMLQQKEQNIIGISVMPGANNINITTEVKDLYHHKYGNCFTINANQAHSMRLLDSGIGYMEMYFYVDASFHSILKLYNNSIDIRGMNYAEYESLTSSGVRMFFTTENSYPDDYTPSIQLSPGFQHNVKISMTTLELSENKGQCLNNNNGVKFLNFRTGKSEKFRYSLSACYAEKANEVFQSRGCYIPGFSPLLFKFRHLKSCDSFLNVTAQLKEIVVDDIVKKMEKCLMQKPCSDKTYSAKQSSIIFPLDVTSSEMAKIFRKQTLLMESQGFSVPGRKWISRLYDELKNGSADSKEALVAAVGQNFIRIKVQAGEATSTSFVQKISFTPADLMATIGGLMGLFMGCSVLTLFEIFELIACLIVGKHSTWDQDQGKVNAVAMDNNTLPMDGNHQQQGEQDLRLGNSSPAEVKFD